LLGGNTLVREWTDFRTVLYISINLPYSMEKEGALHAIEHLEKMINSQRSAFHRMSKSDKGKNIIIPPPYYFNQGYKHVF
jgi:hypothetical protein